MVIGAGKSGVACANLLSAKGFRVLLTEGRSTAEVKNALKALRRTVEVETGGHSKAVLNCGFAVKSPGMPQASPLIAALKKKKIQVFSEIETALAFSRAGKLLAVTGTNGKTTTTVLLGEIMNAALSRPARALVCGNVGIPASEAAPKAGPRDAVVMEVSSYQLEDSLHIAPQAACVLNITPDHLDHHGSMAAYIKAKERIFKFQPRSGCCVFNYEDANCRRLAKACPSAPLFFSSKCSGGRLNAWAKGGKLHFKTAGAGFSVAPPALPGAHNLENAMCAAVMALHCGAKPAAVKKTFASFRGVEHRLEPAGKVRGISFINDSKATNVDSTLVALKALGRGRNICLILGGQDKGNPYAPLLPLIRRHVRAVFTIGAAAPKIEKELAGSCPIFTSITMENACSSLLEIAAGGDTALFSPACASFDQFKDFEDRGRKFKAFVRKLK